MSRTLAVVGGGVIGALCAVRAIDEGWLTTVYDAGEAGRASWVAAAMLGSLGEGRPGEDYRLELSERSALLWPTVIDRLGDKTLWAARDCLFIGLDSADLAELRRLKDTVWRGRAGVHALERSAVVALEPALSPRARGGYLASGEGALDNRRLLGALHEAVAAGGGSVITKRVDRLDGLDEDQVLVTAGIDSRRLRPDVPLIAVKGEAVRLFAGPDTVAPPSTVIRAKAHGRDVYIVPRRDGVVIGATQYESADPDDLSPRLGGVHDLLADAFAVLPGLREYRLGDVSAAMRPGSPDGLPTIGRLDDRVLIATGHGREGVMLAPLTAELVVAALAGKPVDQPLSPERFGCRSW